MSNNHVDKDETTRVNYNEILEGITTGVIASPFSPFSLPFLVYQALKALQASKPTPTENLIEIIKSGKEQGASKLEIEMDKSTSAKIDLSVLSELGGVSINPEFEGKNRILLKVKYK